MIGAMVHPGALRPLLVVADHEEPSGKLMEAGLAAAEHVWATGQSFLQEPVGPHRLLGMEASVSPKPWKPIGASPSPKLGDGRPFTLCDRLRVERGAQRRA